MTMQLPGRVARLEGAFEQIADRLNGVDSRPAALEQKVDLGFDAVERKFNVIYGFLFGQTAVLSRRACGSGIRAAQVAR